MDDDYKQLRQAADKLFHHFKDSIDDADAAGGIEKELQEIVELFDMNKEPRSIDDHIKVVQHQLRELAHHGSSVMSESNLDEVIDGYEELREDLRDLDNF